MQEPQLRALLRALPGCHFYPAGPTLYWGYSVMGVAAGVPHEEGIAKPSRLPQIYLKPGSTPCISVQSVGQGQDPGV